MLVLSRKPKERIILPTAGTTVQVLGIKGGVVRLGIEAPPEVTVRCEEVQDRVAQWVAEGHHPEGRASPESGRDKLLPRLRDRLATTAMRLGLLRLQLDIGLTDEARATIAALHTDFQLLLHDVAGEVENRLEPAAEGAARVRQCERARTARHATPRRSAFDRAPRTPFARLQPAGGIGKESGAEPRRERYGWLVADSKDGSP
jgi:carbon storage regulator CsrA